MFGILKTNKGDFVFVVWGCRKKKVGVQEETAKILFDISLNTFFFWVD